MTALAVALISAVSMFAQPAPPAVIGITGRVLRPDGQPVEQGSVLTMSGRINKVTSSIDRHGAFRIVPDNTDANMLFISVPGFAPYRATVIVPPSRRVNLPAITLQEAVYFRARLVTPDGEPLPSSGLRRQSVDSDGIEIPDPLGHTSEHGEADGSITIGPLPRGRLLLAYNRPPLAQTRLPDVNVTGAQPLIDRGVITIQHGGHLRVDVRDAGGAPVARHEVWLDESAQPSMLFFAAVRTDAEGRATFDRLAPGRYRAWTRTVERCGAQPLTIARQVSSNGSGVAEARLVIGGRALLRITSPLGPLSGRAVSMSPDVPSQLPPWQAGIRDLMRTSRAPVPMSVSSCRGATDADGRLALEPFPPGPAVVRVSLFNSTYIARLSVPPSEREMIIAIPDGLVSAHVTDGASQAPVAGAAAVWTGGGGQVEASATPNGDVLIEGAGANGGMLAVSARGYEALEGRFDETPGTPQEIAMRALPPSLIRVRVVADDRPIRDAVVAWQVSGQPETFTTTNADGVATLIDVPPGPLQLAAHGEGFAPETTTIADADRGSIVLKLTVR